MDNAIAAAEPGDPIRMQAKQLSQAVAMMARAFMNDPLLVFLAPEATRRARFAPTFIGVPVKLCHREGEVWTTPAVAGAACWMLPGRPSPSFWSVIRSGMFAVPVKLGRAGMQRFNAVLSYTEALHKQLAPGPHWYLSGLGVDPAHQGQGLGGRLLAPGLRQADTAGLACYLETMNGANLPFYERHGFEVVSDSVIPGHDLRMWAMRREPRAGGESM